MRAKNFFKSRSCLLHEVSDKIQHRSNNHFFIQNISFVPTSLPKSAIVNFVLDYVYKKSVETCLAHHKPRHRQTPSQKYPMVSHIWIKVYSPRKTYTPLHMQRQNEVALSSSLCFEIGDFDVVKARNAFLIQGFLPSDVAKIVN